MKAVLPSPIVLAVLGGGSHAYFNLADRLFAIRAEASSHVLDEDVGDEFRRWNN